MEDRRMFERFTIDLPVKFIDLKNNKEGTGRMVDLSASGGGMIITREQINPESHLDIWFSSDREKEPVHLSGKVVWSSMSEPELCKLGIQFEKVDFIRISQVLKLTETEEGRSS